MSICLTVEGTIKVNATTYDGPKCPHGNARGAEGLAKWLWRQHLGRPKVYRDAAEAKRKIKGQQGIVLFKDCFTRQGQAERRGDHIDLWSGDSAIGFSDPGNRSKQVWFWALP